MPALRPNTPEARRAVYDKARNALIGQLKAIVPPLPTSEISRQRLELEEAIRRAEREATTPPAAPAQPAASGRPRRPPPPPPPQAPPQPPPRAQAIEPTVAEPPPPQPAAASSPQEVFRRAIREAESRADIAPPPIERGAGARGSLWRHGARSSTSRDRATPRAAARGAAALRAAGLPQRRGDSEPEPRLAPDYRVGGARRRQREPAIPRHAPTPQLDGDDRPARIRDGRAPRRSARDRDRDVGDDFE